METGCEGTVGHIRLLEDIGNFVHDCEWALCDEVGYGSGCDCVWHD